MGADLVASAWGSSWGSAWGNSWGTVGPASPADLALSADVSFIPELSAASTVVVNSSARISVSTPGLLSPVDLVPSNEGVVELVPDD